MKLVFGLGNPGRQYAGTRHNVGYDTVEQVAARLGWIGAADQFDTFARTRFDSLALDGSIATRAGAEKMMLLKPLTFMNVSGRAVQAAMAFYQVGADDVMIVLDDLALPCGTIRVRAGGSSGGHNGLRDIERALGKAQYPRLRIGIDAPPPRVPQKDYVLGKFTPEQRQSLDPAIGRAAGAVVVWADQGVSAAMNQFNAG